MPRAIDFALCAFAAVLAQTSPSQDPKGRRPAPAPQPIRFPLPCDRNLPAENTLFLIEFPPLHVLEKAGGQFFPYVFSRDGYLKTLLLLEDGNTPRWQAFEKAQPRLLEELRGMDRGFSFAGFVFPKKREDHTYDPNQGYLLLGQASDRDWLEEQWNRLRHLLDENGDIQVEEKALGGSPLVAHWLHGKATQDNRGIEASLAYARRGKTAVLHVNQFYNWGNDEGKALTRSAEEAALFQLGAGLGALGLKRGGSRVKGLEVFRPGGTVLGRLVFHLGPRFKLWEDRLKERKEDMTPPMMLGFQSIDGIQDTLWTEGGKLNERIQVTERKGKRSVFDAFAPLGSAPGGLEGILPAKAIGILRASVRLPWIKELFEMIQGSKEYSISPQNQVIALNTIRAILGMPIPRKEPEKMKDFVGNRELYITLALPAPGSFWPEIFLMTPKGEAPLPRKDRLLALAKPFYSLFGLNSNPAGDAKVLEAIKVLGRKKATVSYLNLTKLVSKNRTMGFGGMVMGGVFPGGGKFSVGSNDRFELLSFSPSALRAYLRGRRAKDPRAKELAPSFFAQEEGDLIQGAVKLGPLVRVYPFKALFSSVAMIRSRKGHRPKIPDFAGLARLFTAETFRLERRTPKGGERGILVLTHEGGSFLSPITILTIGLGGGFLSDLVVSFPSKGS